MISKQNLKILLTGTHIPRIQKLWVRFRGCHTSNWFLIINYNTSARFARQTLPDSDCGLVILPPPVKTTITVAASKKLNWNRAPITCHRNYEPNQILFPSSDVYLRHNKGHNLELEKDDETKVGLCHSLTRYVCHSFAKLRWNRFSSFCVI